MARPDSRGRGREGGEGAQGRPRPLPSQLDVRARGLVARARAAHRSHAARPGAFLVLTRFALLPPQDAAAMGDVSINVASWGNSVDTPKSPDEVPALHVGSTDGVSLDQGATGANAPAASMSATAAEEDQEGDEQMAVDEPAAAGDFSEEVAAPTPPHPRRWRHGARARPPCVVCPIPSQWCDPSPNKLYVPAAVTFRSYCILVGEVRTNSTNNRGPRPAVVSIIFLQKPH